MASSASPANSARPQSSPDDARGFRFCGTRVVYTFDRFTGLVWGLHQPGRRGREPLKGIGQPVDFIIGLFRAAIMMGFVVAVIAALACLFMIVFGIATGIDRRIQD